MSVWFFGFWDSFRDFVTLEECGFAFEIAGGWRDFVTREDVVDRRAELLRYLEETRRVYEGLAGKEGADRLRRAHDENVRRLRPR